MCNIMTKKLSEREIIVYVDVESEEIRAEIEKHLNEILTKEPKDIEVIKHTELDPEARTIQDAMGDYYVDGNYEELED